MNTALAAVVWVLVATGAKGWSVNLDAFTTQKACELTRNSLAYNWGLAREDPDVAFSCEKLPLDGAVQP